jgi:ankyrin repeat protein
MIACVILFLLLASCTQRPENMKQSFFDAVKADDTTKVEQLISNGANVNVPETTGGWSALHYAARLGSETMVKTLLKAGADPNYIGAAPGQQGTVLHSKPLLIAQSSFSLAQAAQSNPALHFRNTDDEKFMKDPKTLQGLERVCQILREVTHD